MVCMAYNGMDAIDDFTKVAWPTVDKYLAC